MGIQVKAIGATIISSRLSPSRPQFRPQFNVRQPEPYVVNQSINPAASIALPHGPIHDSHQHPSSPPPTLAYPFPSRPTTPPCSPTLPCAPTQFFFGRRPLPFGGSPLEAYSRTSGKSNHHRQSVRVVKNDALPTEPRGHLPCAPTQVASPSTPSLPSTQPRQSGTPYSQSPGGQKEVASGTY